MNVAIVTGAGSGIGLATAVRLAGEGARVVASDINVGRLDEVGELIRSAGADAMTVPADIGLQIEVDRLVEETRRLHGPRRHSRQQRRHQRQLPAGSCRR